MLIKSSCGNGVFAGIIAKKKGAKMLKDNIKTLRKSKGLSQEELAVKLHAVRQTVSKWERGLSVPDADMLIALAEVFEVPVSTLLGENISEVKADDLKVISEKLEVINLQLSESRNSKRKIIRWLLITLCAIITVIAIVLVILNSSYMEWNYNDPETAMLGTAIHAFEWLFVRVAPFALIAAVIGIVLTRRKN